MDNEKIKLLLREIALQKDTKAYKELFFSLNEELNRFAYSILKSKEDAEEVVTDCFIALWQKKETLVDIENPKLYLFVSIKNRSINKLAQRKRQNNSFNEEYLVHFKSPFFNPGELMLSREAVGMILEAINELPPKCKMIFRLIKEDGLKYADVATLLNISVKTVEAQMAIAVKRISNSHNFKNHFPELHSLLSGKKN
jgi:RNA polymerase sigma-70 factor (family 1)